MIGGIKFIYRFSRTTSKVGKLLKTEMQEQVYPNKQTFQSVEQISKFVSENKLDENEWIFIMKQMLKINKEQILDLQDQEFVTSQLYQISGKIKSKEFLRVLSDLMKSYKSKRVTDNFVVQFRAIFNQLITEQRTDLFEPRSLIVALTILNPFESEKQLKDWDSYVQLLFSPQTRIELTKLEIQIIFRLFDFCQKNNIVLKSKDILQSVLEDNLMKQMKNLQKTDLLLFVKYNSMKKDLYNAEIMSSFISRLLQLKEQFTLPEVASINQFLNQLQLMDAQWLTHLYNVVQDTTLENKLLLCESLSTTHICQSLQYVLEPLLRKLEEDLIEECQSFTLPQKLSFVRSHSLLLLCLHKNGHNNPRNVKSIGSMNNAFYEIVTPLMEGMDFHQTLIFLETASVLGVSKRKICQSIFQLGMKGLQDAKGQDAYKLYAFNQLLRNFITDVSHLNLIEAQFRTLAIDTLKLEADFSHIRIDRNRLIENQQGG